MKIKVDYYGSEEPVTVQFGYWEDDYFVMESCNHANCYEESVNYGSPDYYKADFIDDMRDVWICDKCKAVNEDGVWYESE